MTLNPRLPYFKFAVTVHLPGADVEEFVQARSEREARELIAASQPFPTTKVRKAA